MELFTALRVERKLVGGFTAGSPRSDLFSLHVGVRERGGSDGGRAHAREIGGGGGKREGGSARARPYSSS